MHCGYCSVTLKALRTGVVHCPADQRHRDAQQNKEDPIFSQPGYKEFLDSCYTVWQNQTHQTLTEQTNLSIYFLFHLCRGSLTSALGEGALLLHRRCEVGFISLLISGLSLHVGLTPVPLSAVIGVLMATVVSVLTVATAAVSMPCPPMAAGMVAMFLDLSLCQQACGLPSAGASLVLLVLPIELSINPLNRSVQKGADHVDIQHSFIRHKHVQVVPEQVRMWSVVVLSLWHRGREESILKIDSTTCGPKQLMEAETWALPLDLSPLDRLH